MKWTILAAAFTVWLSSMAVAADYPTPQAPLITDGTGYVEVPGALVPIDPRHSYKMVINSEHNAGKSNAVLPSLQRASMIVNALTVGRVPPANIKIVLAFHGPSVDGLLKNDGYKEKFGLDNPNLKVVKELAAAGVEIFVCAQYLAGIKLTMDKLTPEAKLATAASLVLVTYQNAGYALLSDD